MTADGVIQLRSVRELADGHVMPQRLKYGLLVDHIWVYIPGPCRVHAGPERTLVTVLRPEAIARPEGSDVEPGGPMPSMTDLKKPIRVLRGSI